ncbi:MAG: hypothetical protein SPH79_03055 [Schaalia hyovaginalis]|uniref:hypothetical protein n=1 Tax=Schaalia hyovaginalis TaxID=29316 RepID=UPI002A915F4B|nr:hypothetical protein [Schaalia hyovaginalis]MDY6213452.1 hypothetical protein [Schaalia hyovaginalis]
MPRAGRFRGVAPVRALAVLAMILTVFALGFSAAQATQIAPSPVSNAVVRGDGRTADTAAFKYEGASSFTLRLSGCQEAIGRAVAVIVRIDPSASEGPEERREPLVDESGAALAPTIWARGSSLPDTGGFAIVAEIPNAQNSASGIGWRPGDVHVFEVSYDAPGLSACTRRFYAGVLENPDRPSEPEAAPEAPSGGEDAPQSSPAVQGEDEPAPRGDIVQESADREDPSLQEAPAPSSSADTPIQADSAPAASEPAPSRSSSGRQTLLAPPVSVEPAKLSEPARRLLNSQVRTSNSSALRAHEAQTTSDAVAQSLTALSGSVVAAGGVLVLVSAAVMTHVLRSAKAKPGP